MRRALLLSCGALLSACAGFGPVHDATRRALRPLPLAEQVQRALREAQPIELELECDALTGVFDALLAADGDAVVVQLFPDVGGKVFELRFARGLLRASSPAGDYRADAPLDDAEPHLAVVLALLLGELLAPCADERLRGERRAGDGLELQLVPALGAGEVVARLAEDGRVASLQARLGWVEVEVSADGRFRGRGFRGLLSP